MFTFLTEKKNLFWTNKKFLYLIFINKLLWYHPKITITYETSYKRTWKSFMSASALYISYCLWGTVPCSLQIYIWNNTISLKYICTCCIFTIFFFSGTKASLLQHECHECFISYCSERQSHAQRSGLEWCFQTFCRRLPPKRPSW